jgi:hypothetical protein
MMVPMVMVNHQQDMERLMMISHLDDMASDIIMMINNIAIVVIDANSVHVLHVEAVCYHVWQSLHLGNSYLLNSLMIAVHITYLH